MKHPYCSLFLTVFFLSSCDKAAERSDSGTSTSHETLAADPKPIEKTATATERPEPATPSTSPDTPDAQTGSPSVPQSPPSNPSNEIPDLPQEVADQILGEAAKASCPEERSRIISEQTSAWRRVDQFREKDENLPDHRKRELLEALGKKHGFSWTDMAAELDAQLKAYDEVMEYRLKGIPGLNEDESFTLTMQALERLSPDYRKILSVIRENAKEK